MFNSKFNNVLTIVLIVAIILIVVLIGIFGYSIYNKYYISNKNKEAMDLFDQQVSENKPEQSDTNQTADGNIVIGDVAGGNSIYSDQSSGGSSSNNTVKLGGYNVIGKISIPKIKLDSTILDKPTTKALKLSIVYLTGPGINKVGNTVLQGHNYKNGMFFSDLSKLSKGDAIYLTDETGTKVKYEVYDNTTKRGDDASFYNRDTAGLREINLSTCTTDAALRTVIFAREVAE